MEAARFVQYARKKTARWSDEAKSVVRRRHELVRQQQATIVKVVSNEFALSATAFQEQGDAELNTEAAFRARQQLRRDPGILVALDQWWKTALGAAAPSADRGFSDRGRLRHRQDAVLEIC